MLPHRTRAALLGLAVGDALGVPVEFQPRQQRKAAPVTGMRAFGTHRQPAGTWSDDSSLSFCLAESLCTSYDLEDLADRFVRWYRDGYWTAHGSVFDIGIATRSALDRLALKSSPVLAGGADKESNGNGSLMRILPLIFRLNDQPVEERFRMVREVSSLTHRHIRSVIACFVYCEMALPLLAGESKQASFRRMQQTAGGFLRTEPSVPPKELRLFSRILEFPESDFRPLAQTAEQDIRSSGYVLHTLEAALWCLLTTTSYEETVLRAVNLGEDTDTTGAVAGGLAGLLYGAAAIPAEWLAVLAKRQEIEELAGRLAAATS